MAETRCDRCAKEDCEVFDIRPGTWAGELAQHEGADGSLMSSGVVNLCEDCRAELIVFLQTAPEPPAKAKRKHHKE
jgi:hypothetical protein